MQKKPKKPLFLIDAMLGNIAKKLRLLGYDSSYSSSIKDSKLIEEAIKDDRIIVTKDQQLTNLAKKEKLPFILITANKEIEQILQIYKKLKLEKGKIDASTSRCTLCNGTLNPIEKNLLYKKIPEGIFKNSKNFWLCSICNKIYWQGSHIDNLQEFVLRLNEKL